MGIQERKEREKEQRREDIISAAERVFFEKGLQVATMDEIAERAELGKSTLYLYYRSKEDLYLAVLLRGSAVLLGMFQKVVDAGGTPISMIARLADSYYEFFKNHRDYFRTFYFFENPLMHTQVSEEMKELCSEGNGRIWSLLVDVIRRGMDEGEVQRGLNPMQIAVMLWSGANGLMRQMDRDDAYWRERMGVDLDATLKMSNTLLLEAIMTDEAKVKYPEFVV
jgi:AcrR family transcriptional regulator